MSSLVTEFISYISTVKRYSHRTSEIYSGVLEEFAAFVEGDLIGGLSAHVVRAYQVHLLDVRKLNPRTVNLHLSALSSFSAFLVRRGDLSANPVKSIAKPKVSKRLPEFYKSEDLKKYFEQTEVYANQEGLDLIVSALEIKDNALVEKLYNKRLARLIISILYTTGIRRSELISLRELDLDFSRSVVRILGKGDKMREIPIISDLSKEISLYLQVKSMVVSTEQERGETLLITLKGGGLYPNYVDRVVKKELAEQVGIKGRKSPHVLRHSLATDLLNDGADLNSIKELLGHSSLAATQVYTHNTIEKIKNIYLTAHPRAKKGR